MFLLKGMVIPGTVLSQNHSNFILQSYQWDGQHANIPDTHKTAVIISVLGCLIRLSTSGMKCWDLCRCLTTTVIRVTTSFTNGGNSNVFLIFTPKPWGFMKSNLMVAYFWHGWFKKPSTRLKDHGPLSCVRREIWFCWMWEMWLSILDIFLEDVKLFQGWKDLLLTKKKTSCKKHLEAFKVMVKEMGGGITGFDGRNLLNHPIVEGVMFFFWVTNKWFISANFSELWESPYTHRKLTRSHEHDEFQAELAMAIELMKTSFLQNHGVSYCDFSVGNTIELYLDFVEHLRPRSILNLHLYSSISIFLWLKKSLGAFPGWPRNILIRSQFLGPTKKLQP